LVLSHPLHELSLERVNRQVLTLIFQRAFLNEAVREILFLGLEGGREGGRAGGREGW